MDLALVSVEIIAFLFFIAIIAGFIDTLAGGGGLITLPALMMSGVPPLAALGTNKLQASMGTATATYMMLKKKRVDFSDVKLLMLAAFIGSVIGTIIIQYVDTQVLTFVIPVVLLLIAIYFIVAPVATETAKPKLSQGKYQYSVVPAIGAYDGMFGPGTGSFFALAGVSLRGHCLVNSTAVAKTLNFATNFASLIVFVLAGQVVWLIGLLMMLGQVIGAWLGSHCLFKVNPSHLRMLVVVMCLGMLLKYSFSIGWIG